MEREKLNIVDSFSFPMRIAAFAGAQFPILTILSS